MLAKKKGSSRYIYIKQTCTTYARVRYLLTLVVTQIDQLVLVEGNFEENQDVRRCT